jgi:hypothetical protein
VVEKLACLLVCFVSLEMFCGSVGAAETYVCAEDISFVFGFFFCDLFYDWLMSIFYLNVAVEWF